MHDNIPEDFTTDSTILYDVEDKTNPKTTVAGLNKSKIISFLEAKCQKLVTRAQERGDWKFICQQTNPTQAAERLAIFIALKDKNPEGDVVGDTVVCILKRVKRALVRQGLTVLESNEQSNLPFMIDWCEKRDAIQPMKAHHSMSRFTDYVESEDTEDDTKVNVG